MLCFLSLCLVSCLPAHAQYGGSGWTPLPNPNQGTPQNPVWNWDGLVWTRTLTPYGSPVYIDANSYSGGFSYPMEHYNFFYQVGPNGYNGNSCLAASQLVVNGSCIYKWQWNPAGGDLNKNPQPKLYALEDVSASISQSGNPVGMTGDGSVSDGLGWSQSYNTLPNALSNASPNRRVTGTGADTTLTNTVKAQISPRITTHLSAGSSGGTASTLTSLNVSVFPILLFTPNPLGRPDLGDGTNQYVYDSTQPNGLLTVPASVSVAGSAFADTAWALPHVALSVSPAMQTGAQPFSWLSSGSSMYVYTNGTEPDGVTSWPSAAFCYVGLPPDNSYFGNHTMTMAVDGKTSQTANYQLFFNGIKSNWIGSDSHTPNWFHFYNQVYPPTNSYAVNYLAGSRSYTDDTPSHNIHLGDNVYPSDIIRVFAVQKNDTTALVKYIGYLSTSGILNFVETCAHEHGHQLCFSLGIEHADSSGIPIATGDGDLLNDTWEQNHHMDSTTSDTTKAYGSTVNGRLPGGDIPDNEVVADIQALGPLFVSKNLWRQDWADGGIQHGQPPLATSPGSNSPDLYLWFYPVASLAPNPDGSWSMGSAYKVWALTIYFKSDVLSFRPCQRRNQSSAEANLIIAKYRWASLS